MNINLSRDCEFVSSNLECIIIEQLIAISDRHGLVQFEFIGFCRLMFQLFDILLIRVG